MTEDEMAAKVISEQLASVSDAELGAIFRKLLVSDHAQVGLYCRFQYHKWTNKGHDYSQPPTFDFDSPGCGCCSQSLTGKHDTVMGALAELLGDQQLTND